jgi:hypothetical protein
MKLFTNFCSALLLLSILPFSQAIGQNILYLKPHLNGQFPLNYYDRSIGKASNFSSTHLLFNLGGGLDIQLELNSQLRLSLGAHYGSYGFGYSIKTKFLERGAAVSNYITRIPLQLHYTIKDDVHLINLDKIKYNYLLVFRLYSILGVSYNRVMPPGNQGEFTLGGNGNIIIHEKKTVITNWNNASIYMGIGMQFLNGEKNRFDVSVYYSKGIGKIGYKDLSYEIDGNSYQSRLWSRGTIVGFNVSYPIKLKTFRPKLKLP